jgi:hypothetical protein
MEATKEQGKVKLGDDPIGDIVPSTTYPIGKYEIKDLGVDVGFKDGDWEVETKACKYGGCYVGVKYKGKVPEFEVRCPLFGGKSDRNCGTKKDGAKFVNSTFVLTPITLYTNKIPPKAKETSIESVRKLFSDSKAVGETIRNCLFGNQKKIGGIASTQDPANPKKRLPVVVHDLFKYVEPDLAKAAAKGLSEAPQFYQIKIKIDCDYRVPDAAKAEVEAEKDPFDKNRKEVENKLVKTPICIDGKVHTGISRKQLNALLVGRNFYGIFKGKIDPFVNSNGVYMKILATEVTLKTLSENKQMTDEEKEKFKERGAKALQELDFADFAEDAEGADEDGFTPQKLSTEGRTAVVEKKTN